MISMRALIFLLLCSSAFAQLSPPTQTIKKRHGQSATVAWNFVQNDAAAGLLFFSVKSTPSLSLPATQFKQVPKSERHTDFVVLFTPQDPDKVYYVISAVYDGTKGESFASNTIAIQRQGKPPQ